MISGGFLSQKMISRTYPASRLVFFFCVSVDDLDWLYVHYIPEIVSLLVLNELLLVERNLDSN